MNSNISLGNKVIGIITFVIVVIVSFILIAISTEGYFLIISLLLILIYSIQASKITYIKVSNGKFFIENIFKRTVTKDLKEYKNVSKLGFGNLMEIQFMDNSRYLFWGKSLSSIKNQIKQLMQ